ncbi:hypothetical protein ACFQX6_25625 [Streptosporangium lutulentum]
MDGGDDGVRAVVPEPGDERERRLAAMPRPCQGVPTTQAMAAWSGVTVAWT